MLEGICNLEDIFPNLFFGELDLFFLRPFEDQLEISLFRPLDGDKELVQLIVDKPIQVPYDVGVI